MAERKPIISFRNFSFQYRAQKRPTLTDINLEIYPGAVSYTHLDVYKRQPRSCTLTVRSREELFFCADMARCISSK